MGADVTAGVVSDPRDAEIERLRTELAEAGVASARDRARLAELERASELSAGAAIDGIPGFVAILAADGHVQIVNRQIMTYCGKTLEELRNWDAVGIVHDDDATRNAELFMAAIADGTPYDHEMRLRRFDGVFRWFSNRGVPVKDANGKVLRWYVLLTDIDDRKRAEEQLAENERNLLETINAIPTLAWCNSLDGSNEFLNQRWHDYTGLSPEEANGWGWQVALHPDDLPGLLTKWTHMLATGEPGELEARLRRHDGVYRWFLFRCDPLRDHAGNIVKWYGTNTDIEDLKIAEAGLRRSEAFLAQGEAVSETGSFLWNPESNEIRWSDQMYRIFDVEPGTPVTTSFATTRVHPQDLGKVEAMMRDAQSGADVEAEHRLILPDGSIRHLHFVAQATRDAQGRLEYMGTVQNITERKLAEQALDKVRSELAHAARVMSLGVLTASLAHEVNQPLSGIVTNANTSVRMLSADPPNIPGALETARRTIRDANRASDVVARLRALFGKKEFAAQTVDLVDATREVIALSAHELQRHRVSVQTEFDGEEIVVTGDRVQLQQVVLNLVLNACDAVKGVDGRPRAVFVRIGRDDTGAAHLAVRDTGIGVAPEVLPKLFDPFYTTKTDGMGIGLSVSRSIIDRHQGRLWAVPNDGPGATFAFTIPCAVTEAATLPAGH